MNSFATDETNIFSYLPHETPEKGSSDSEESHVSEFKETLAFSGNQKLWNYFQMAAISIAQLYKQSEHLSTFINKDSSLIKESFQNASLAITSLYKDALENQQKTFEIGFQVGQKKRLKELYAWLNASQYPKSSQIKKCNYYNLNSPKRIRKEELLAYLEYLDLKSAMVHNSKYNVKKPYKNHFTSPRRSYLSSSPSPSPNSVRSRVLIDNSTPPRQTQSVTTALTPESLITNNFDQALKMNSLSPSSNPSDNLTLDAAADLISRKVTESYPLKRTIIYQPDTMLNSKKQKKY